MSYLSNKNIFTLFIVISHSPYLGILKSKDSKCTNYKTNCRWNHLSN